MATTPSNLYEYYTGQGQTLPTVASRAPLYQAAGGTGTYTGTEQQNQLLLGHLLNTGNSSNTGSTSTGGSSTALAIPNSPANKISGSHSVVQAGNQNSAIAGAMSQVGTQFPNSAYASPISPTTQSQATGSTDAITTYTKEQAQVQKDTINKQFDGAIAQAKMMQGLVPGAASGFDEYITNLNTQRDQQLQQVDDSTAATLEQNAMAQQSALLAQQKQGFTEFKAMLDGVTVPWKQLSGDQQGEIIAQGVAAGFSPQQAEAWASNYQAPETALQLKEASLNIESQRLGIEGAQLQISQQNSATSIKNQQLAAFKTAHPENKQTTTPGGAFGKVLGLGTKTKDTNVQQPIYVGNPGSGGDYYPSGSVYGTINGIELTVGENDDTLIDKKTGNVYTVDSNGDIISQ